MRRFWWAQAILALTLLASVVFCVLYTNRVDERGRQDAATASRKNDQRWCDLLRTLTRAYSNPSSQPTTELGRQVAIAVRELNDDFGC